MGGLPVLTGICILSKQDVSGSSDKTTRAFVKGTFSPKLEMKSQNRTVLELHSKTELQHSAKRLKQLET